MSASGMQNAFRWFSFFVALVCATGASAQTVTPDWAWEAHMTYADYRRYPFGYASMTSPEKALYGAQKIADDGFNHILWNGDALRTDILDYDNSTPDTAE